MPNTENGFVWSPEDLEQITRRENLPVYDNGNGIPEMLEEALRLCPNDPLLNDFYDWYDEHEYLTRAQYENLKRFYDCWGGNTLP